MKKTLKTIGWAALGVNTYFTGGLLISMFLNSDIGRKTFKSNAYNKQYAIYSEELNKCKLYDYSCYEKASKLYPAN